MDVGLPSPLSPFLGAGEQLFSWDGKANVELHEIIWAEGWTSFLQLALGERRSQELAADLGGWINMGWAATLLMPMASLL